MPNPSGETLDEIVDEITQQMEEISQLRDGTLSRSRRLIRDCAHSIRAMHRHELAKAEEMLAAARRGQHLFCFRQLVSVHGADAVCAVADQAAAAAERAVPQLADLLHLLCDLVNNFVESLSGWIGHKSCPHVLWRVQPLSTTHWAPVSLWPLSAARLL